MANGGTFAGPCPWQAAHRTAAPAAKAPRNGCPSMDAAAFALLNGLAAHVPTLRVLAILMAKYGIVFYAVLLLALWARSTHDRRKGTLLLAVAACGLALGANAVLNILTPRPRPFLTLPATVLVPAPHDPSFPSDHAAVAAAVSAT